jgi:glycosyltransferase involved in cell wall biosynthesis
MSSHRPLRVLHIIQRMRGGGAERQIAELLPRLQSSDIIAGLLTVYESAPEEMASLEYHAAHAGRKARYDFSFVNRLIARIRAFAPDIVHTHMHAGRYWGRFAAIAAGVPVLVHTEHSPGDPRRGFLDRLADRVLDIRSAARITFFPEQRAKLVELDGLRAEDVFLIPAGLDFDAIPLGGRDASRRMLAIEDGTFAIMMVGRLDYPKNTELAICALAEMMPEERKRAELVLAGSGVLEARLRALASSLGVSSNVRFLGHRRDVPQLLSGMDLFLVSSRFEGMPLAMLEAMHAGVPILTTPWIGVQSMLQQGRYGRIAPSWDPKEVAREIGAAMREQETLRDIAVRARAYVHESFSITRIADLHCKLYRTLWSAKAAAA